jgi:enamine deaminase RidA (YjgF/YER057c/UK114 family)
MTWYVTDLDEYRDSLAGIGAAYREIVGRHFPAMAVVGVTGLVEPAAKIEIETMAVVPE